MMLSWAGPCAAHDECDNVDEIEILLKQDNKQ